MKKLHVELTTAEAVTIIIALDRLILARGDNTHVIADNARNLLEHALIGEPWPEELDPAEAVR